MIGLPERTKLTHLACGANQTFVLTEQGDVFSWGEGVDGALG